MDARQIVKLNLRWRRPTLSVMFIRAPIVHAVAASVLVAAIAGVAMMFVT